MKKAFAFAVTAAAFILFSTHIISLAQSNYYVSSTGDDAKNGRSKRTAFASITHAATIANHGDTIWVLAGTYTNPTYGMGSDIWKNERTVEITDKTTRSNDFLTIQPQVKNSVLLKGDGSFIFQIKNSNNIRIQGFRIRGESDKIPLDSAKKYQFTYKDSLGIVRERIPAGTPLDALDTLKLPLLKKVTRPTYFNTSGISVNNSHHIEIIGNTVSKMPGEGIRSFKSDFLTIVENTVSFCSSKSSTGVHGISIYTLDSNIDPTNINFEGQRVLIARNKVFSNYNELISWSDLKDKITPHIDEGKGITIQRCTEDYFWFKGIIRIENNIAYRNGFSGIQINSGSRVEILHNTCYENNYTSNLLGEGDQHGISVQDGNAITIANNIVQADPMINDGKALKISTNSGLEDKIDVTDNLIIGIMNNKAANLAVNTQSYNPLFSDIENGDFSLQGNSRAIGSANPRKKFSVATDFFGNPRDSKPDLGAIEYLSATSIKELNISSLKIFPNPAQRFINVHIETDNSAEITYTLLNINGQHMLRPNKARSNHQHSLDVSSLANGIYFLHIYSQQHKVVRKIIIQR